MLLTPIPVPKDSMRLGSEGVRNNFISVFRELGRVMRTPYLLEPLKKKQAKPDSIASR